MAESHTWRSVGVHAPDPDPSCSDHTRTLTSHTPQRCCISTDTFSDKISVRVEHWGPQATVNICLSPALAAGQAMGDRCSGLGSKRSQYSQGLFGFLEEGQEKIKGKRTVLKGRSQA